MFTLYDINKINIWPDILHNILSLSDIPYAFTCAYKNEHQFTNVFLELVVATRFKILTNVCVGGVKYYLFINMI